MDTDPLLPTTAPQPFHRRINLHRSLCRHGAAAAVLAASAKADHHNPPPSPRRPVIVLHAFLFLLAYLALGVTFYAAFPANFTSSAEPTHPIVDALYFCIVTLCTIGYGDITPASPAVKLFAISFVLIGFVDILLSGMVSYVLDLRSTSSSPQSRTPLRTQAQAQLHI
ncbi:hypothetical protein ZWY2020_004072 [Hordeum vulgare]|nr:hypothetical protein ZWY2020_004072 [Hordeum vulgare]